MTGRIARCELCKGRRPPTSRSFAPPGGGSHGPTSGDCGPKPQPNVRKLRATTSCANPDRRRRSRGPPFRRRDARDCRTTLSTPPEKTPSTSTELHKSPPIRHRSSLDRKTTHLMATDPRTFEGPGSAACHRLLRRSAARARERVLHRTGTSCRPRPWRRDEPWTTGGQKQT